MYLCHVWKGRVRGIKLQHATSPLDVTKFYTLNPLKEGYSCDFIPSYLNV